MDAGDLTTLRYEPAEAAPPIVVAAVTELAPNLY